MTTTDKPREFWIRPYFTEKTENSDEHFCAYERKLDEEICIHVIEYSAYAVMSQRWAGQVGNLEQKLAAAEAELQKNFAIRDKRFNNYLSLESDNARLRAALEKIANHKMDSVDKVYLIHQCEGFQTVAREALGVKD